MEHGRGVYGWRRDTAGHKPAHQVPPVWRAPEEPEGPVAVPVGGGGAWPDNESTRRAAHQRPSATGMEGAGGTGGHVRASRSTTPSRRLACGDLAGGRGLRRPEHQRATNNNSRHGRLVGGPPPTGTHSAPAPEQGTTAPGTPATQQPMFHVKHLPNHRPRYPVSRGKWHT